jgi:hypothetical protein
MSAADSKPSLPEDVAIEAGKAQLVMLEALSNLTAAVIQIERIAMAVARRLDASAKLKG